MEERERERERERECVQRGRTISVANVVPLAALGLAVARDGSSGGVLRLAIIEESGVSRSVFTGPEIPQFYNE